MKIPFLKTPRLVPWFDKFSIKSVSCFMRALKECFSSKSNFIAASPVTIHKENIIRSQEIPNIYNRYAVTLKADGERYFLYITIFFTSTSSKNN